MQRMHDFPAAGLHIEYRPHAWLISLGASFLTVGSSAQLNLVGKPLASRLKKREETIHLYRATRYFSMHINLNNLAKPI